MRSSVVTSDLCLPITALENVLISQRHLLLAGQGPFLHVYDLETNVRLLTTRIFTVQVIYGIGHGVAASQKGCITCLPIALFGGSSIGTVVLEVSHVRGESRSCKVSNIRVSQAPEWILKVHYHLSGVGSPASTRLLLLTANNCLQELTESVDDASWSTLDTLAQGPKSSLYSGDISAHSRDHLLIAGGSVFGEVVLWACKKSELAPQWEAHASYSFTGHHGSIFGVCISPELSTPAGRCRFVASCSDDRTIQVWDVTDHELRSRGGTNFSSTTETGFGHGKAGSLGRLAITSAHVSRIWDVNFVINPKYPLGTQKEACLISRGEDATCQIWSLKLARNGIDAAKPMALQFISADHHHSGKSTLACTWYTDRDSMVLISGGADGRIIKRPLRLTTGLEESVLTQAFKDISVGRKAITLKDYLVVDTVTVTATTTSGLLLKGQSMSGVDATWKTDPLSSLTPVTKLCSNSMKNVIVAATRNGMLVSLPGNPSIFVPLQLVQPISWMRLLSVTMIDDQSHEVLVIVTFSNPRSALLVRVNTAYLEYEQETVVLDLPSKFSVTSACYFGESDLLFLGSRTGSLAVYSGVQQDSIPPLSTYDIHSPDTVTSLQIVQGNDIYLTHVLSTGRDGRFAIHAVRKRSYMHEPSFRTLYISSPQFGMNIEGAALAWTPSSIQPDLILFGFQSTSFVVWNYTKQAQMLSIDCGGSHRNWAYHLSHDAKEHAFVWTKASTFNLLKGKTRTPVIVREGGHGREIKALAIRSGWHGQGNRQSIIATGAEDTTIRLFALQSSTHRVSSQAEHGLEPLIMLTEHTTGVQHLAFSSCGNYLFSSGGSGEFFVWSVVDGIPIVGLGVYLLDRMVQASDDLDARILSFDVVPSLAVQGHIGSANPIHLVAAYSNGKVRVINYTPGPIAGSGSFVPIAEIIYGSFCLTQVRVQSTTSESQILVAGTNGYLYGHHVETMTLNRSPHSVHQSSVLAMDCIDLGSCTLSATGGDDNALALTVFQYSESQSIASTTNDREFSKETVASISNSGVSAERPSEPKPRTFLIPKAHAAALTALKIVCHQERPWDHAVVILTIGNDQRVIIWGIKVQTTYELDSDVLSHLQVVRLQETWTCVADVSSVDLIDSVERQGSMEFAVVIVGIGMEVLQIKLDIEALLEGA